MYVSPLEIFHTLVQRVGFNVELTLIERWQIIVEKSPMFTNLEKKTVKANVLREKYKINVKFGNSWTNVIPFKE